MGIGLRDDLGPNCLHVCVDMQKLFGAGSPWMIPWSGAILPAVAEIAGRHAARTLFTRFIPARRAADAPGVWARYYERWQQLTLDQEGAKLIDLLPPLAELVPPARVLDKHVYSPWTEGKLDAALQGLPIDTLIVTGGETDVCVLATVMGGVDRGYRMILVSDALCSSTDDQHDALMNLYRERFNEQLEVTTAAEILSRWRA